MHFILKMLVALMVLSLLLLLMSVTKVNSTRREEIKTGRFIMLHEESHGFLDLTVWRDSKTQRDYLVTTYHNSSSVVLMPTP